MEDTLDTLKIHGVQEMKVVFPAPGDLRASGRQAPASYFHHLTRLIFTDFSLLQFFCIRCVTQFTAAAPMKFIFYIIGQLNHTSGKETSQHFYLLNRSTTEHYKIFLPTLNYFL